MYAFSPTGSPIRGTAERLSGCAETSRSSFVRDGDGKLDYDHDGYIEIFWDDSETVTDDAGEVVFIDEDGDEWSAHELVLSEDPDWAPEDAPEAEEEV